MNDELKKILMGLGAAFGVPWLFLLVFPYLRMASAEPVPYTEEEGQSVAAYPDPQINVIGEADYGAQVYAREGCAYCHTQVIRPTYAGADMWRPGWGGRKEDGLARETRPEDYSGEKFAYLGYQRIGPDLANVGSRITDREWHHRHLYDPRSIAGLSASLMPSYSHLYDEVEGTAIGESAGGSFTTEDGRTIVPTADANALVEYLLSRQKDQKLPAGLVK